MGTAHLEHPWGEAVGESRGRTLVSATQKQYTTCELDFKPIIFFFLAAENIPILLTKESGVYSALVKNPLTHVRDKFAPKDSKESSQSSLACKESLLLLKSILRQNVFSPAQLANSTGWY